VQGILRGESIRKSLDLTNWEAANKLARDWEVENPKDVVTLEQATKRFIADMESRKLSRDTIKKFEPIMGELTEQFSGWNIKRFTPDNLGKYREKWDCAPTTGIKKLERLRSFFKFCVDRDWILKNPAKALKPPKETSIEKKPYDTDELDKIAWAIPLFPAMGIYGEENSKRIGAFIATLRWTGLRIRDVVQLKRTAIEGEMITIRTQKNGVKVQLPIHPDMKAGLETMKNSDYFFWSGSGNAKSCVGDWQRTLRRLAVIAGVHIHAHRWRHTFATTLLSKGVPVSEVAAILGNSPRIIEKHYSQWIQARQESLNAAVRATF
jgi:integrase